MKNTTFVHMTNVIANKKGSFIIISPHFYIIDDLVITRHKLHLIVYSVHY